jgi:hypothetical protein
MRNFNATYAAELAKEVLSTFMVYEFDFSTPHYETDSDTPVYRNGHKYLPRDSSFDQVSLAAALTVDKVNLEFDNADLVWSAMLLAEDVRNKAAVISKGVRLADTTYLIEDLFYGLVDSWKLLGFTKADVTVANELALWAKKTLRNYASTCPWTFVRDGSGECRYSGSGDWCDYSWDRCNTLGNSLNFGGEKYMLAIQGVTIWWGRTQSA